MNLLNNKHIVLSKDNDLFGTSDKAKAIKSFLEGFVDDIGEINMFALYGKWGSGKSSVLKYLEQNLNKSQYKTLFFDTWEYEKDVNLPLSFLSCISDLLPENEQMKEELFKTSVILFKSFFKGITIKTPFGFDFSNKDYLEAAEKELKYLSDNSFHRAKEDFKAKYREIEDKILEKDSNQKLIVFIDDIDRCDPENVLNLISAIKLFFTYGKRTVFLFALDEDAVHAAIKTKYKDVIKAEEYLEKVFDITFNMPKVYSSDMLIESCFKGSVYINGITTTKSYFINEFFKAIKFDRPRHTKKIINKFYILKSDLSFLPPSRARMIPYFDSSNGGLQESILCLFFIILYEYYTDKFEELEKFEEKLVAYNAILQKYKGGIYPEIFNYCQYSVNRKIISKRNLNQLTTYDTPGGASPLSYYFFPCFLSLFTPIKFDGDYIHIVKHQTDGTPEYIKSLDGDNILIDFCNFLIKNKELFTDVRSNYEFENFFNVVKLFL